MINWLMLSSLLPIPETRHFLSETKMRLKKEIKIKIIIKKIHSRLFESILCTCCQFQAQAEPPRRWQNSLLDTHIWLTWQGTNERVYSRGMYRKWWRYRRRKVSCIQVWLQSTSLLKRLKYLKTQKTFWIFFYTILKYKKKIPKNCLQYSVTL